MDTTSATLPSGSGGPADAKLERNKRNVLAFYEAAINGKDFAAASRLIGDRYVQHNPSIADGAEGLERRIEFTVQPHPQRPDFIPRESMIANASFHQQRSWTRH